MIKVFRLFTITILLSGCNSISKLYVNFGKEKSIHSESDKNVVRIYFDRKGFIYPGFNIDDKELRKSDSRLERYYYKNRAVYDKICLQYNVKPFQGDLQSLNATVDPLQNALVMNYVKDINDKAKGKELVFIIHGFNEHPALPADGTSSFYENKATRDSIVNLFPRKSFLFVEIYWDGLSADNGSGILRYTNSLKIWNNAQPSATYSGIELRRILSKLNSQRINVITHSHGAGVITTSLFNVIKFRKKLYTDNDSWLFNINSRYNNSMYNTPTQEYYIGMLAPAIPGVNVFDEYQKRTINGKNIINSLRNYHFVIGFNENDPVTGKFKIAARKLGSTTLGCKKNELANTKALLGNNPDIMDHEDFSKNAAGDKQDDHSWFEYMNNQPHFSIFLSKVFR